MLRALLLTCLLGSQSSYCRFQLCAIVSKGSEKALSISPRNSKLPYNGIEVFVFTGREFTLVVSAAAMRLACQNYLRMKGFWIREPFGFSDFEELLM